MWRSTHPLKCCRRCCLKPQINFSLNHSDVVGTTPIPKEPLNAVVLLTLCVADITVITFISLNIKRITCNISTLNCSKMMTPYHILYISLSCVIRLP